MLSHGFHCGFRIATIEMLNNALVFVDNFFHVALDGVGEVADAVKMGFDVQNSVPDSLQLCCFRKASMEHFIGRVKAPEVAAF